MAKASAKIASQEAERALWWDFECLQWSSFVQCMSWWTEMGRPAVVQVETVENKRRAGFRSFGYRNCVPTVEDLPNQVR